MMATPQSAREISAARLFHETTLGEIYLGDALALFRDAIEDSSVDLIMTSPPFGLVRKKTTAMLTRTSTLSGFARSLLRSSKR